MNDDQIKDDKLDEETSEEKGSTPEGHDLDLDEEGALADALGDDSEEVTLEGIDQLLAQEAPDFHSDLAAMSNDDFSDLSLGSEQVSEEVSDGLKPPSFWKSYYNNIPQGMKLRIYISVGMVVILTPMIILLLMGKILPKFELPYAVSMSELTDDVYTYPVDGIEVPLFDDFRSDAVTYGLPKTMINLKREGGSPSYGEFEFFLNLREKETEGIVRRKQSEIMDLIQRVLEQITWRDLQTPVGKEKVKKVIRHRVNEYLQGNLILGVYYRSILLQK